MDFPAAALGLVFFALFWPGLDGLDLWVWAGLGFARYGGLAGVSALLLVGRRYFFLEHPIYQHVLSYCKYSSIL